MIVHRTYTGKLKVSYYITLCNDLNTIQYTKLLKFMLSRLINIKPTGTRLLDITHKKGYTNDDFLLEKETVIIQGFTYKKPRFIK